MTIPSRPAPAPPMARGQSAAAGANASIEQLRLQLQQQQQQQQQNGGIQKLTIKLPPPPRGSNSIYNNNNNINNHHNHSDSNSSSVTRKFPQARYTPTTNWDDSPFGQVSSAPATATMNGNAKKVPPPRPPPPKVQVNGRKANMVAAPPTQSTNILSNIFHRKKSTRSSSTGAASRVYSVSSGIRTSSTTTTNSTATHINSNSYSNNSSSCATANWNANWNSSYSSSSLTSLNAAAHTAAHDAQLISFDSPPSSPTFTQKSNSDCLSVDSFSSDSNFSSPNNGSVSQPESGFEDDFSATAARSRPATTSPLDPWEAFDAFGTDNTASLYGSAATIGTAPVRNLNSINTRMQASNDNPLCNGKSLLPPAQSLAAPTIIKPKVSQKPRAPKPPLLPKPGFGTLQGPEPETPPSPPMPQCPPPPPPTAVTLLDVISGKADALQLGSYIAEEEVRQPYGVALYDFDGVEEGDLSFRENEKIYLLEQVSAEWYRGRTRAGCEGIFPSNYVDVKVPLSAATATTAPAPTPAPTTTSKYQQQNGYSSNSSSSRAALRVRCLFNFPAEYDGDLALKENDMVTILYRINEDWLFGEIDGRQGQFPSNFLEYVPANIPMP